MTSGRTDFTLADCLARHARGRCRCRCHGHGHVHCHGHCLSSQTDHMCLLLNAHTDNTNSSSPPLPSPFPPTQRRDEQMEHQQAHREQTGEQCYYCLCTSFPPLVLCGLVWRGLVKQVVL